MVIARPGRLAELWNERQAAAESLGAWLGGFDEMPWQAPHTFIGFYDGPVKVDFFYQEGEPASDPWLRDGFAVLVDPGRLTDDLRDRLAGAGEAVALDTFDAHAWDWLWWLDTKLGRGHEPWLVYIELVRFAETMLIGGHNALTAEPWRNASAVEERLPEPCARSFAARCRPLPAPWISGARSMPQIAVYERLRRRLAEGRAMPLADELADQVRNHLGGA